MTAPGGGHNDINLAALWIPVMPETSHMGEEMRKAGGEAKKSFEDGFNSSGSSPESIGQSFGSKLQQSISKEMQHFELPLGMSGVLDKFSSDIDTKLVAKLKGEASQALDQYREKYEALTAAEERAAAAETQINIARDGGFNKASIMLPLISEQTKATTELQTAHTNAGAALDNYTTKTNKLTSVTEEASASSGIMAGVMGGAVVAGAQMLAGAIDSVVEKIIEGAVEAFKMGAEGAKEFADTMIELGETYEHVGIQITEFSGASGESFEEMEKAAQKAFSNIDVAGADTGKTMAQFASIMDVPGASVEKLVEHVTDLQGRFTGLRSVDLATIFNTFKVPAQDADSALASLLQSARNSGQDLGQFASAMQGNVAMTLNEANLSLGQAGAFMADMMKLGEPGRQTMTGLASAMKEFGKEGISFGDGMKKAGEDLKALGDTAEGQDYAEKLFGTRNWIAAKQAVQDYVDIVAKGPNAFNASSESVDDFIERTRTLENEWEIVKHKAEEAFLPMGEQAVKIAGGGLDSLVKFVDSHMDQIKHAVITGGLEIIKVAASLQTFGQGLLEFFAPVAEAIVDMAYGAIEGLGGIAKVAGVVLKAVGLDGMGQGLIDAADGTMKLNQQMLNFKIGDKMRDASQWMKDHKIDVDAASQSWVNFAQTVGTSTDSVDDKVVGSAIFGQGDAFRPPTGVVGHGSPVGGLPGATGILGHGAPPQAGSPADSGTGTTTYVPQTLAPGPGQVMMPVTPSGSGGGTSPNGFQLGAPEQSFTVNGIASQGASGGPADRLQQFAQWFNDNIEPVKEFAGYDRGGHGLGDRSNHASGTALDINWDDFSALQGHGADARSHFSAAQMQEISQQLTAMGMTWGQYWTPDSRDPGHFELSGADYSKRGPQNVDPMSGQPTQPTLSPRGSGSVPGGKNGGLFPGLPGQYGGNGVYGGQTTDQMVQAQQNIQEAQDRASDLDYTIQKNAQRVEDLKKQLGQVGVGDVGMVSGKPMPRTAAQIASDDKKRETLNEELNDATHSLAVSQRERSEQDGKISEAQRKAQESMYKKPTGAQAGGNKDAQSLGSGLLQGIGQELGLGDVLGKSPLDWGIVKLAEGLFSYANNLGDAIFGKSDSGGGMLGGTPGGTQGLGAGLGTGLLGSLGIKLPSAAISGAPNVVPGAPTPFGTGGPLPGPPQPGVVNNDNSITVSPNVDPTAILNPVIGLQRDQQGAYNGQSFKYAGGVPAQ